jgi:signal transduction histidine kinase
VEDDGKGSLWLSTTRGICHIDKKQLEDFAAGRIRSLSPVNYGVEDGLRSAQCAPGYPTGGGGTRTKDGRLWFPTSRGLAVYDPAVRKREITPPLVQFVEMTAEGQPVDFGHPAHLPPGDGRMQIRYTSIHLSAPERVRYSYKLQGLDADWVQAAGRRVINYNSLPHGHYNFTVRAALAGGPSSEASYSFDLLPHFYETVWFRCLAGLLLMAAAWGAYQMRLQQIRSRFALVLGERARLAREIHDTLAQGFVGVSMQLELTAHLLAQSRVGEASRQVDRTRDLVRDGLADARRSIWDLRAAGTQATLPMRLAHLVERSASEHLKTDVEIGGMYRALSPSLENEVFRIAQEALANAVRHSEAACVALNLRYHPNELTLTVSDNGKGFQTTDTTLPAKGHFGLQGMRERAGQIGGMLRVESSPESGTTVTLSVPLSNGRE